VKFGVLTSHSKVHLILESRGFLIEPELSLERGDLLGLLVGVGGHLRSLEVVLFGGSDLEHAILERAKFKLVEAEGVRVGGFNFAGAIFSSGENLDETIFSVHRVSTHGMLRVLLQVDQSNWGCFEHFKLSCLVVSDAFALDNTLALPCADKERKLVLFNHFKIIIIIHKLAKWTQNVSSASPPCFLSPTPLPTPPPSTERPEVHMKIALQIAALVLFAP